jgi:hypothetical protein
MALLRPGPLALVLFAVALALAARVYAPLWLGRRRVTRAAALGAHKYLVAERLVLMSAVIAIYAPPAVALGLLVCTLAASLGAQWALRDRYERQSPLVAALGGRSSPAGEKDGARV